MFAYRKWIFFSLIMFSGHAFSLVCPDNKIAPLCPNSGSTLLDETYPTQAFVISNAPYLKDSLSSKKVTEEYVTKIAKSYNYKNIPQVFIAVSTKEEFESIVSEVKNQLKNNKVNDRDIQIILEQISHAPSRNYTWQQDYFESFVDLKTGTPVLREFQSYFRNPGGVSSFESASKNCQIKKGQELESHYSDEKNYSFGSGEMGGNVEGAPAGFCLTGDNLSKELSKKFCGSDENIIQLQTSWLRVGHVDEIFKIIPSKFYDNRPKECQFSLMAASPQKAMDLLANSQTGTNAFFNFSPKLREDELLEKRKNHTDRRVYFGAKYLCGFIKNSIDDGSYIPGKMKNASQIDKMVWVDFLFDNAQAALETSSSSDSSDFKCSDHIDQVSNRNIGDSLSKDDDLKKLNQAIQESINSDKLLIKNKILSRLPQCKKYFDILDVPNLFYGSPAIENNGKLELPKPSDVDSFLPNPTNSVLMNRTILLPETGNSSFDSYVESELKKRNLSTDYIDSWDYAHLGQGNIHCSSHSIPYCKPR